VLPTAIGLASTPGRSQSVPVLVELFTSEGCSSCPPADRLLETLAATQPVSGAQVVALGQHVDYWDRLGWRDRFSSAAFTERQQHYGQRFRIDAIYTPQMVVDGRDQFVGSDMNRARRAIGAAVAAPHGVVSLSLSPASNGRIVAAVEVTDLPDIARADRADFHVAVTENNLRSDVRAGENKGRHLTHFAVVRQLSAIGEASAPRSGARSEVELAPEWQRDRLTFVAFVQERVSRRVLGAAAVPLQGSGQ
jgi:hypothetical protein